jgi:hypothetical protein
MLKNSTFLIRYNSASQIIQDIPINLHNKSKNGKYLLKCLFVIQIVKNQAYVCFEEPQFKANGMLSD